MAKVAMPGSRPFGGDTSSVQAGTAVKRKTPSELRGEQLKRTRSVELAEEPAAHLLGSEKNTSGMARGLKKQEVSKNPRYIATRMDEVYPVRKSSNMFKMLSEKAKDGFSRERNKTFENPSVGPDLAVKGRPQLCPDDSTISYAYVSAKASTLQSCQTIEKCSQNTFRTVAELSRGNEKSSVRPNLDMNTVLKGLSVREAPTTSQSPANSLEQHSDLPFTYSGRFSSEFQIPGYKTPIDLTLKTTMRLVSSSSVNWCHRLTTSSAFYGTAQFMSQFGSSGNQSYCDTLGGSTAEVMFSKALHSWVFPQSSLPSAVISAFNLTTTQGEVDFLLKRQLAWEDSFRSLYYLLRKSFCDIFYVCTSQFVVMFTGGYFPGKTKRSCNAYISQSTRGLRSLLREQDICFSMPLCHSEEEQATMEDLVELAEMGKHNPRQTRHINSVSDMDNSPRSLLAFTGNGSVHGLYDFLLNYRSFLSSLSGVDVPVLYSPVPFQSASFSAPEVKCKELKNVDAVTSTLRGSSSEDGFSEDSTSGVCYSIEIKDTILPPWTICGICAAMGTEGRSFEACFTNEPNSVGFNIAFDALSQKTDSQAESDKSLPESNHPFGVPEAVIVPCLQSASLRGLKYSNGSYTGSLSPI